MFVSEYRFKFYINARHSMTIKAADPKIHPHTWELVLYVKKSSNDFIQFTKIEKDIQLSLSKYEGKLLNDIPPFTDIMPTMENIGEVLSKQLESLLSSNGWVLSKLEISENPTRSYIISNDEIIDDYEDSTTPLEDSTKKEDNIPIVYEYKESSKQFINDENANDKDELAITNEEIAVTFDDCIITLEEKDNNDTLTIQTPRDSTVEKEEPEKKTKNVKILLFSLVIVLITSIITILWISRNGAYPWSSDAWGHLLKAKVLYDNVIKGNLYPLYTDAWYNGTQPFRYWAPLPYYILLVFELITKCNLALSYNLFIVFTFIIGSLGWILWGIKVKRALLGLILGIMWFFLPENLRVLFSDGNIPRVLVAALFPLVLYVVWLYIEYEKRRIYFAISVFILLITISHAMIAAMTGIALTLFALFYGRSAHKVKLSFEAISAMFLGYLISGIWLLPALSGGIVSMNPESLKGVMSSLTYPFYISLNPLIRLHNPEMFYFGISIVAISLIGLLFGDKKSKVGFLIVLLIFLGTTKSLLSILIKIPMSQLFWMMEFTPLAFGIFISSMFLWKKLKKYMVIILLFVVAIDSIVSFRVLGNDGNIPLKIKNMCDKVIDNTVQRTAILDRSQFGSFPSFYLYENDKNRHVDQVYGWAWQGAATSSNIMWINTAEEKGWYSYMFDRCLELGADTVAIRKEDIDIKELDDLNDCAGVTGYNKIDETELGLIYKKKVNGSFGTSAAYKGIGIGKYSGNISLIFPTIENGSSDYIDNYTVEELEKYKIVFLSGFKYRNKNNAEDLVKQLSCKNVKVIIDLTNAKEDIFTSRASFLNVSAQPVIFKKQYPQLEIGSKSISIKKSMPSEYTDWRTLYLENLDQVFGKADFENQDLPFLGTKINSNIIFIGFNIPFFSVETKDKEAVKILEDIFKIKAFETPKRSIIPITINYNNNNIIMKSDIEGTITGIAYLDAFKTNYGNYEKIDNLVCMSDKKVSIRILYPYLFYGTILSLIGLIAIVIAYVTILKKSSNKGTEYVIIDKGEGETI